METHSALALLEWQIELGADEAIGDVPVNRLDLPEAMSPPRTMPPQSALEGSAVDSLGHVAPSEADPVAEARAMAAAAPDLAALREALTAYDRCDLKRGARNLVFADGNPAARVMIVGEAPGRDEDLQGLPFVGRAGQLLDQMFAAIGLDRASPDAERAIYITNMLPWRPPQNRDPTPEEIAMMMPFVRRHVELADPDVIVAMGNHACQGLLGRRGITRLRGAWDTALGKPVLPMFHPAYLLRTPHAKREAWADLLMLQARLREAR
ncbi:uracil-DNA glycosylase [Palleronia sp. KMU-117]|uniref:uracil-DNA glycosylase n=1 Tax=Palleronia sp. KMU-117 TaxID=3434108 RepID=UPI003D733C22